MHHLYEHSQKTFSGWYLIFLFLALIGIVLFVYWNLAHPRHVI